MAVRSCLGDGTAAALVVIGDAPRRSRRPMLNRLAGALAVASICAAVAACGDTRSNKDLGGVATWPMGGPASGPWVDPQSTTTSYNSNGTTTTETTTTRTVVRPTSP